jgi:hypothetical protein
MLLAVFDVAMREPVPSFRLPPSEGSERHSSTPRMSNNKLVFNPETGQKLRLKQAREKEAAGQIVWVDEGKTFRNATFRDLPAIIAKRNEQAKNSEPLGFAELPGVIVRDIKIDYNLIAQANALCPRPKKQANV